MILKTLHWYIFRELLRNFLLTAVALTTILAFGGTFKPLTKYGLDVGQLMWVLLNTMPAMLAYAIPLAALFAAVQVYWRLSTDNEVTACRAGGLSYYMMLAPALLLGISVAAADLVFVNYVVPVFLQRTERAVRKDLGSLLVHNIGRGEPFEYANKLVVYADRGAEIPYKGPLPPGVASRTIVRLEGMAASPLKDGKQTLLAVAKAANVIIDEVAGKDEIQVLVQLEEGFAYRPDNLAVMSGSVRSLPLDGTPMPIPSPFRDKVKFLNFRELWQLSAEPTRHNPIQEKLRKIAQVWRQQHIATQIQARWQPGAPMTFSQGPDEKVVVTAPAATLDSENQLAFTAVGSTPVRVDVHRADKLIYYFTADRADFQLAEDSYSTRAGDKITRISAALQLSGNALRRDVERGTEPMKTGAAAVGPVEVPSDVLKSIPAFPIEDLKTGNPNASFTDGIRHMGEDMRLAVFRLVQDIRSEQHSRVSFAVSCLALVLLGAALGILMRGQNPLFVFVVGFVPAIILVLLITAGKRMVEAATQNELPGLGMIWLGNVILLAIVAAVYAKLLRS